MGRRASSGLVSFLGAGLLGAAAVIGCSANGASDVIEEAAPTAPAASAQLPPSLPAAPAPPAADAGAPPRDAGRKAAPPVDAGPPPPAPGDGCTTPDQRFARQCGACGVQEALCLFVEGATSGTITDYGPCEGQVVDGCVAGTVVEEPCGNCGTQKRTCTAWCDWGPSQCTGQPANACTPGAVELSNAGCGPDLFRSRSCSNACQYDGFSLSCSAPPTLVKVPPTVGMTNSTIAILRAGQTLPRLTGDCPDAKESPTVTAAPYAYLQVENPTAKTAKVAIYNSQASGGGVIQTVLAAYPGVQAPLTTETRKACIQGFNSYGTSALTGTNYFASLDGIEAVTIPAGGSVTVFVGARANYDAAKPAETTGRVALNVLTEALE